MCSFDTSDFLQELWIKYLKCSFRNKSENLLGFLRSLYYSSMKGRNRFQSVLFANDVSEIIRLLIRELLNDLENVCIDNDEGDKGANDVRNLREYLRGERGTLILFGIDAMLEKIVSTKENKIESVRSAVLKIINDAELSNILATTLISVLSLLDNDDFDVDNISEMIVLPDSSLSQNFYEQLHRSSISKKPSVHRISIIHGDISSDETVTAKPRRNRKPKRIRHKFGKADIIPKNDLPFKKYGFDALSGTEIEDLSPTGTYEAEGDSSVVVDGTLQCGDVLVTLRIITRLFGHMILFDPSLCSNASSIHLELFSNCCKFLGNREPGYRNCAEQLEKLAHEILHNIGVTMRILFVERDNNYSSVSMLLGHKVIERLLLAYQLIAESRASYVTLIGDINKLIVYIFIIVSKKVLLTGNHTLRGIIQLMTSWHLNGGASIALWTLNEETDQADSLILQDKSKPNFFTQLCTFLSLMNEFSLERRLSNPENKVRGLFSHHNDKFNLVPTANRKDTVDMCCYAMICELLLNNLIFLLTKDSNSVNIGTAKKRVYQQLLFYIKTVRFCCSIDIFSYSCQLLRLLVNQKSNTVKTVILRFLQILLEISFEFYKSRDSCVCQYTSRHDISLILRDIRDVCLPVAVRSTCPRQQYPTSPVDLLHFFDWLARSYDNRMKSLVIEVVIHPILARLQTYSANSQSLHYHLIGAAVLSLMPYLNSPWNVEDLNLISTVCSSNDVLQSTFYKCVTVVVLSKATGTSASSPENEIKTRIIDYLLSSYNFDSFMRSFNGAEFSSEELIGDLLENVHIWRCYRVLFSYNEEFRKEMFVKAGIDSCYLILKEIIKYIGGMKEDSDEEVKSSVFSLFESFLCLVVDGNMLKGTYYYEGFSCEVIWTQLQVSILHNIPSDKQITKLLMNSIFNCCFRQRWTVQDGLYQLRQVFLNSIINMTSSCNESDLDSDSGDFDVQTLSVPIDSDIQVEVDDYDADVSSGASSFDESAFLDGISNEPVQPSMQRTNVFMTMNDLDETNTHLEINCSLVHILLKVILSSPTIGYEDIFQETLEALYCNAKTLPEKNQRLLISDDLVYDMSGCIIEILTRSESTGLHLTLLKLLIMPGSSWCTSTRLRFLIEISKKNESLTTDILQMLIDKASLIRTLQPEISIKFPIDQATLNEREIRAMELLSDNDINFDYLVHYKLTDSQWKSLDPDCGDKAGGFSVCMWIQMDVICSSADRRRAGDYKKNKKRMAKQVAANKRLPQANDTSVVDMLDSHDLVHIISLYSLDKLDRKKTLSIQIWCKPSFGTVVIRLYESVENPRTTVVTNKTDSKQGLMQHFTSIFGHSTSHDNLSHYNQENVTSCTFSLVDELIIHGFVTSNSWNFLTVTVNWRPVDSTMVTLLLNGDVKRHSKLNRSPSRISRASNTQESFVAIGHVSQSPGLHSRQHYNLGRIFLFENPIFTCGNDNLSMMLLTPNWDGVQIISNQRDETNILAAVVMGLLVDLQNTTESAALLIERGQNILANGWQAKIVEHISSNLVGTYSSEDPYRFNINASYSGGSSFIMVIEPSSKLSLYDESQWSFYSRLEFDCFIVFKCTLDSALERLGGIPVLIFWLAKFVEKGNETSTRLLLKLFLILLRKSIFLSYQNRQEYGYSLLFQLFKSFRMNINFDMITEVISHTIYESPITSKSPPKRLSSSKLCRDPYLLRDLLLQWKMWATSKAVANENDTKSDIGKSVELDRYLLSQISDLLNEDNVYSNINCGSLGFAGILSPLLLACQEPFDTLPAPLPSEICKLIVQIITNFIPTPADLRTVTDLCSAILHLYTVSTRDSDSDPGIYFRHIRSLMDSEWDGPSMHRDPKHQSHSICTSDKQMIQENSAPSLVTSNGPSDSPDDGQISKAELRAMQMFYGSTLSASIPGSEDSTEHNLKDIEKSGDSVGSNSSIALTLINDDDDPSFLEQSFQSNYLSSGSLEEQIMDKTDSDARNHSSRIDTLVGLISALENVIQVKISDTVLVQLSMENFCFEFIIHLLTHDSPVVRHRSLSLFRVYVCQKKLLNQNAPLLQHMIDIVAYIIHQHVATMDIVAETVSIIFGQNITALITAIDWGNHSPETENCVDNSNVENDPINQLPRMDSKLRLSGIVSIIQEQDKSHLSFDDLINRAGNHFGLSFRRSSELLLSTMVNIEYPSMVAMLRFCDWLFIQNPLLLMASIRSGLLECVCNMCNLLSQASVTQDNEALQALLGICETISTDLTATASYSQFVQLLEMCDIVYFSGLKLARKTIDKWPHVVIHQYIIQTIINTTVDTICILNEADPVSKIKSTNQRLKNKIERLPQNHTAQGPVQSQKLIKTINAAAHIILNTQEYLFPIFIDLFQLLGLKLVDFVSKIISNCLSCNSIPDHFSVYLCAKELIKTNLGDLIIFLTNPKLDISLRLELLHCLLKLDNVERVTRYSLLGNSSGSMCLILNIKRVLVDIKGTVQLRDPIYNSISSLLRVISLDFDVEIIKEDNRNLWIQDCNQKLNVWKHSFNETVTVWNSNAERCQHELLANLKKYQNSYRPHARKNLQKQFNESIKAQRSTEFFRRRSWKTLIANFTQERAIWSNDAVHPQFMQLDPTEGPCRIRRRMVKTTLNLDKKFFTTDIKQSEDNSGHRSLDYLFDSTYAVDRMVFQSPIKFQLLRCIENSRLVCSCMWVCQSGTFDGEFFVASNKIGFMVDNVNSSRSSYDQLPNPLKDYGFVDWKLNEIKWVLKRRFKLRDLALEIFMKDGRNCLIAASTTQERDSVANCIESSLPPSANIKPRLLEIQHKWVTGELTNFDYLTILNTASGRSYNDVMQYPVFPFILRNYSSEVLDLQDDSSFRDLSNPIAVQNPSLREKVAYSFAEKAEVYQTQMNIARMSDDVENLPIWALPPHHYSSLYSNSGTVLYYMIRVPPFTQKFIEFQDHQFDRPDRMFHTLESAWNLSTSSMSCVKEIIPEFFYLPEMFVNNQSFNFGERHSGIRVDDVILPSWCNGDARLFCLIHRAALESPRVSATINTWIDLIFGYKQTGKAALDAMNLFHPYTYYKAICPDEISEPIRRKAVEQMIENYGQVPKQLFLHRPHSSRKISQKVPKLNNPKRSQAPATPGRQSSISIEQNETTYLQKDRSTTSVLENIIGIRWGDWVGSPQNSQTFINTLSNIDYPEARSLYLMPLPKYKSSDIKKSHKVLILPQCSDILFLSTNDEDSVPIIRFSAALMRRRLNLSSMTLCNSYSQEPVTDNQGSFFVSIGSGRSSVSCMVVYQRSGRVFVGMDSGLIQVYQGDVNKYSNISPFLENFGKHWRTLSGHDCAVTHMVIGESFAVLASSDRRANVAIWDSQRLDLMHYIDWATVNSTLIPERLSFGNNDFNVELPDSSGSVVSAMCFSETLGDLIISRTISKKASNSQLVSNVSLFTINGQHVQSILVPGIIVSLSYTNLAEGRHVNAIAVATIEGRLTILSSWDLKVVWKIKIPSKNGIQDPVRSVQYSHSGKELFVLHESGHVKVIQSHKTDLQLKQSVFVWL